MNCCCCCVCGGIFSYILGPPYISILCRNFFSSLLVSHIWTEACFGIYTARCVCDVCIRVSERLSPALISHLTICPQLPIHLSLAHSFYLYLTHIRVCVCVSLAPATASQMIQSVAVRHFSLRKLSCTRGVIAVYSARSSMLSMFPMALQFSQNFRAFVVLRSVYGAAKLCIPN